MALQRYSVTQVDAEGYDWYTLHTDSLEEAIAEVKRQRTYGATVAIYDNTTDKVVETGADKLPELHPVFQGIFDAFLTSCVRDTVNNGDTAPCPVCGTVGCYPEAHGTYESRQGIWFPGGEE